MPDVSEVVLITNVWGGEMAALIEDVVDPAVTDTGSDEEAEISSSYHCVM